MKWLSSRFCLFCGIIVLLSNSCSKVPGHNGFVSNWPAELQRTWIGPDYWANPLQDWEINNGKLTCLVSDGNRNVSLLTWQVTAQPGDLDLSVRLGLMLPENARAWKGWGGFRIGAHGRFNDYRDDALYGVGIDAGVTTTGHLFIGAPGNDTTKANEKVLAALADTRLVLKLQIQEAKPGYRMILSAWSAGEKLAVVEKAGDEAGQLTGLLALVADFKKSGIGALSDANLAVDTQFRDIASFWFTDWRARGDRLDYYPDREFGPILFAQHTLSKGILTMTAQMPPVSAAESQVVILQQKNDAGIWQTVATDSIHPLARTATFKVPGWPDSLDLPYRLVYDLSVGAGKIEQRYFEGTIWRDPVDRKEIVVAGFTGNNDLGFPNNEVVKHVLAHQPDLLFFSGDQIYEPVAGYGVQREPLDQSCLDYLRKWYIYGWEYRELLRNIPTVAIPDDHDVYHGNLWGEAGKAASKEGDRKDQQDSGGYTQPPAWVNMVQRTQTSHLPDPYDPTPVQQGIGVYYTDLVYGGVSFGIIEDRKFKSAPKRFFPETARVKNGWAENQDFNDPAQFDVAGAELLGERQMAFLEHWVSDWSHNTWMKVLLSQTIFSTVATLPDSAISDVVVPTLRILAKDAYPPDDRPTQDMDSNGWPKRQRDRVLRTLRKGFAMHLAGDQHLGSTIHYGVDDWGDAAFALCVPSVSNYFPRRWYPQNGPVDWQPGVPKNLGRFYDGFGNRMTVHAVANPHCTGLEPAFLYDRAAGYGIVRLNRDTREIQMANWPRQVDPTEAGAVPYEGWPVQFHQLDNYGKKATDFLPTLEITGLAAPVIQVIEEASGEIVYTLRIAGTSHRPGVFRKGQYTIHVGEGTVRKTLKNVQSIGPGDQQILQVDF